MRDSRYILTLAGVLVVLLAVLFLMVKGYKSPEKQPDLPDIKQTPSPISQANPAKIESSLPLDDREVSVYTKRRGNDDIIEVETQSPEQLFVSAITFRLFYEPDQEGFRAEDVTVQGDLGAEGWSFPVKSVELNDQGQAVIDFAAINISPTGGQLSGAVTVASITIPGFTNVSSLNFDPEQTKLITKEGKELKVNFKVR